MASRKTALPSIKSLRIKAPKPFAFEPTVRSHGWYLLAPFEWNRETRVLGRTETLSPASAIDLEISFEQELVLSSTSPLAPHRELLTKRAARMFQVGVDISPFVRMCAASPAHHLAAKERFGRILCGSTLFEDVVKIIATTNTTWRQTVRMISLLVEHYGPASPSGRRGFPTPHILARVDPAELQTRCRLGYRSRYVHALSTGIIEETIDLDAIADPKQPTVELLKSYRQLPGIGPYGAAHLLAMDGRHDHIAVDTEFRRFVRERYYGGRKVSDQQLLRRYRGWGEWKYLGYWSELWMEVRRDLDEAFEKKPQ